MTIQQWGLNASIGRRINVYTSMDYLFCGELVTLITSGEMRHVEALVITSGKRLTTIAAPHIVAVEEATEEDDGIA